MKEKKNLIFVQWWKVHKIHHIVDVKKKVSIVANKKYYSSSRLGNNNIKNPKANDKRKNTREIRIKIQPNRTDNNFLLFFILVRLYLILQAHFQKTPYSDPQ